MVQSQTLYQQDFENGFGDMTVLDVDQLVPNDMSSLKTSTWEIREDGAGNSFATANSYFAAQGTAEDWLITPLISGITANTVLKWRAMSAVSGADERYEVRLSEEDTDDITKFTKVLSTVNAESSKWNERGIGLTNYNGKKIRLAFKYFSINKRQVRLDDIIVYNAPKTKARLVSVSAPRYNLGGETLQISYELRNLGSDAIKSYVIQWSEGGQTNVDSVKNQNIRFYDRIATKFKKQFTILGKKQYDLVGKVISINGVAVTDDHVENNNTAAKVRVLDRDIPQKMFVEEATGTWCTWCPRGAVNMAKMKAKYPEEFTGIAVHNSDPMVLPEYDDIITSFQGFTGFPGVVINRKDVEDPGDMEGLLVTRYRTQKAPGILEVNTTMVSGRTVSVAGTFEANAEFRNEAYKIICMITEDEVKGTTSGYAQVNSYAGNKNGPMGGFENLPNPVPASMMVYQEVAREMYFGFNGSDIMTGTDLQSGEKGTFTFDVEIPQAYNINNVHLAIAFADEVGNILSSGDVAAKVTGTNDLNDNYEIALNPNPTSDISYLHLNLNDSKNVSMSITNSIGQVLASKNYGQLSGEQYLPIHVNGFQSGMYFVSLSVGKESTTQKLIVK